MATQTIQIDFNTFPIAGNTDLKKDRAKAVKEFMLKGDKKAIAKIPYQQRAWVVYHLGKLGKKEEFKKAAQYLLIRDKGSGLLGQKEIFKGLPKDKLVKVDPKYKSDFDLSDSYFLVKAPNGELYNVEKGSVIYVFVQLQQEWAEVPVSSIIF